MNETERKHVEELIERLVHIRELPKGGKPLHHKIDILERVLEELRFHNRYPENDLRLEDYIAGQLLADNEALHYAHPSGFADPGTGTRPILFQPNLLLFLLLNHRQTF